MCVMGNGNDMLVRIPSWKFPDEKHDFNNVIPVQPGYSSAGLANLKQASWVQPIGDTANNRWHIPELSTGDRLKHTS